MRIGFIGAGNIGNPMARHLLDAGHQLTVHDINRQSTINLEEMGATWAPTPKATAQTSDIIFTSLPGPKEVEAVALGPQSILEGASKGSVYVDLSTSSPSSARRIHQQFKSRSIAVLDAPVSGGVPGAEAATLSIMVGGDKKVFDQVSPILLAIGEKLIFCGPPGSGMVCKICNNLVTMGLAAFLPEVLTLGVEAGVDLKTVANSITSGSGNNWVLQGKFPNTLFQNNFKPGFALNLAAKDVHLATELGHELDLPMEASNLFAQTYRAALRQGLGNLDADAVALLYEERTGTKLRLKDD